MRENLTIAFQGLWNHKLRSALTMLGIIIGIASIITIVSTIKGTSEQIKANLVGAGTNAVSVRLHQKNNPYDLTWNDPPEGVIPVSEETRQALARLDHVEGAALFHSREWCDGVYAGDHSFSGALIGADAWYLDTAGYGLLYGREFSDADFARCKKVCLLDAAAVSSLFGSEFPLGGIVEIMGEPFTVVGVVNANSAMDPDIRNMTDYYTYYSSSGGTIFVPDSTWPLLYRFDEPETVLLKSDSTDNMTRVGQEAANLLTATQITGDNGNFSYRAIDIMEQAEQIQQLSSSTNSQLIWIASISLLVGGIGVMNIMLVTVTERTTEIGLKKALGARKKRILYQFLTEAAVLTSCGGLVGVLSGVIMARLISAVMGTPTAVSAGATLIALAFSTIIGVVFGLLPAVKAANLNPIEALRRE